MNERRAADYVRHMLEAAQLACSYVKGFDQSAFIGDRRTQQAVILNLVVIGEAATKLAAEELELVHRFPELPWKNMRGMRNRIAHGYFDIDLTIVWQTVQTGLPTLIEQLTAIHDALANGAVGDV